MTESIDRNSFVPRIDPIRSQTSRRIKFPFFTRDIISKRDRLEIRKLLLDASKSSWIVVESRIRIAFETTQCRVAVEEEEEEEEVYDLEDVWTGVRAGIEENVQKIWGGGAINENVLSIMWAHPGNVCDELENFHPVVHLSGGSLRPPVSRDSKFSLRSRHLRVTNKFS